MPVSGCPAAPTAGAPHRTPWRDPARRLRPRGEGPARQERCSPLRGRRARRSSGRSRGWTAQSGLTETAVRRAMRQETAPRLVRRELHGNGWAIETPPASTLHPRDHARNQQHTGTTRRPPKHPAPVPPAARQVRGARWTDRVARPLRLPDQTGRGGQTRPTLFAAPLARSLLRPTLHDVRGTANRVNSTAAEASSVRADRKAHAIAERREPGRRVVSSTA